MAVNLQKQESVANLSRTKKLISLSGSKQQDFQVRVHIIDARDLQPRDSNGMSDPLCLVEIHGDKRHTATHHKTTICTWDHLMFWELKMTPLEFFGGKLELKVMDANTVLRDVEIGSFELDLSYIYDQNNGEVYRRWVGLSDNSGKFKGIQGYLRVSAVVLGPGDIAPAHNEDEENDVVTGSDLSSMILLPPTIEIKNYNLSIYIFRAESLPKMDQFGTCDGYCIINFAGAENFKTDVKKNTQTPEWNEKVIIPFTTPTLADRIKIQVRDYDRGTVDDDIVGTFFLSLEDVMKKDKTDWSKPRWVNLYGSPSVEMIESKASIQMQMNKGNMEGSSFRGRILVAAEVTEESGEATGQPRKETFAPKSPPASENYFLRFDLFEGNEMGTKSDILIEASVGAFSKRSKKFKSESGHVSFYTSLEDMNFGYPKDLTQVPDLFVNVYKSKLVGSDVRMGYLRIPMVDLHKYKTTSWQLLTTDRITEKEKTDISGFIQLRVELVTGRPSDTRPPLEKPVLHKYVLRAHLFQGRELLTGDSDGFSDPYCVVRCGKSSGKTKIINSTVFPIWYETVSLNVQLPEDLSTAPDVHVSVYDWDRADADDFLGRFSVQTMNLSEHLPSKPVWHPLFTTDPDKPYGEVLASFQLIPESQIANHPVPNITPVMKDCILEIDVIGLKNVLPHNLLPIMNPFIEFDAGTKEKVRTKTSNKPQGHSANFLETLKLPVKIPESRLFAPPVNVRVIDDRKIHKPLVATRSISLANFIPWEEKDKDAKPEDSTEHLGEGIPKAVEGIPGAKDLKEEVVQQQEIPLREIPEEEFVIDIEVQEKNDADESTGTIALLGADDENAKSKAKDHHQRIRDAMKKIASEAGPSMVQESFIKGFEHHESKEEEKKPERETYLKELELVLSDPPYSTYHIFRGKALPGKVGAVKAGEFKGKFNLYETGLPPPPKVDLLTLFKPTDYVVRIYILEGFQLVPKDAEGNNPYVRLSNGRIKIKDENSRKQVTSRPQFFKCYEMGCTFPFETTITIEVWDWDLGGELTHDLIGKTRIDLENRFYHKDWKEMKKKPIEYRTLWNPTSSNPQGQISMWIDIMTPDEAKRTPQENCAPPPSREYELRVIIWDTKNVVFKDDGKSSDIFVVCYPEGQKPQNTDTHWKSKNGEGLFNWRMKFPIVLPSKKNTVKIQVWDQDVLNPNDAICEANLNLTAFFKKAFDKQSDRESIDKQWISMTHPANKGVQGELLASFELLTIQEALAFPAGFGRKEPNTNPTLEEPQRPADSLAPWAVDKHLARGFSALKGKLLAGWKLKLGIAICVCVVLLVIALVITVKILLF